ncbi:MAG TPA: ATP-binding protein, partial [Azospirillaceae bacterium]|nr:ATP-binding protein [Azospirillaceae bacterium]
RLLDEALDLLAHHGSLFPISPEASETVARARVNIRDLRDAVNAVLADRSPTVTPPSDRRQLADAWYEASTEQIETAQEMRRQILFATPVANEHLVVQSQVKHFTWVASEFVGRERARVGGRLALGESLGPHREALAELHGKFALAWEMVRSVVGMDMRLDRVSEDRNLIASISQLAPADSSAAADFADTVSQAERAYDRYQSVIRPQVFGPASAAANSTLTAVEWWHEASLFIDALRRVQDASIAHTAVYTAQLSDAAARDFAFAIALLILDLLVTAATFTIIHRRIVLPVKRLTQAMVQLAEDDLSTEIPHPGHPDEIGAMADAVAVFKRSALERRQLSALQVAMLKSANNCIIATDAFGVIQVFSPAAERMLGYTADEMVGLHTPTILHLPEELAHRARQLAEELATPITTGFEALVTRARAGLPDQAEWTYVRKDGSHFPVLLSAAAIWDEDGELLGFLGIGTDISELKEVEQLKSEFISTVSHELRTPLTAIRASLGMVASGAFGPLPDEASQLTDIALQSSERLVRLINDILDVEKIASGALKLDIRPVQLQDIVERAIIDIEGYAGRFGVTLNLIEPHPEIEVLADPDRLIQVFTNLLSNATKFSPSDGNVEIAITRPRPGWVRVAVIDHGPGIPEGFQDKVFTKFAQADASDRRSKGGTGLGLNITKSIVERLNGRVWFTTEVGGGTTFYVELPVWVVGEPHQSHGVPAGGTPHRPRILVCEDDGDVAKLLAMLLDQAGFATTLAGTAAEARHRLQSGTFDAMTLDLRLPDESGIELIRALRADPATREFPIIVVSAVADQERRLLNGDAVAIIDWLNKPIDEERLIAGIQSAVHHSQSRRSQILHVEDDLEIAAVIAALLADFADVTLARTLAEARQQTAANHRFDLAIIDLGLPDGYGLDILPELKDGSGHTIPVVVFTALETSAVDLERATATLIKSRVSNGVLVETIRALIPGERETGEREPASPAAPVS